MSPKSKTSNSLCFPQSIKSPAKAGRARCIQASNPMMGSNARRNGGTCDLVKLGDAYRLIYESGPHDALTDIALATLRALIERRMGRALQSNENAEVCQP